MVGTNHKYSPLEIRERLAFSRGRIKAALLNLVDSPWIKGAVILSTCHRVELYASTPDLEIGDKILKPFLSDYHNQELVKIDPYLYCYIDKEAILHLFKVAGGLDSKVIGEFQILDQVRSAFEEAKNSGCVDSDLNRIFSYALKTGRRVREETQISEGDASLGSIVIDLIKEKLGSLKDKKILIIGAGKVSELISKYLKEENVLAIFVSNRNFEKAKELANYSGGEAIKFVQLKEKLKEAEVIITATASPHFILKKEDIQEVLNYRLSTLDPRLLIIDLAVPRDVEPEVKYLKGVELFCLDNLDFIIKRKLEKRRQAIPTALKIIKEEVENLCQLRELEWEPEPVPWP